MRDIRTIIAFLLMAFAVFAQSGAPLEFDAASLKPSAPRTDGRVMMGGLRGGPETSDPGRFSGNSVTLRGLIERAWDLRDFQLETPSWMANPMDSGMFDLSATIPVGATKAQANVMLQSLLIERFHMKVHHSSKEVSGYELIVAKGGAKLKPATQSELDGIPISADAPLTGPMKIERANGVPQIDRPGLVSMITMNSHGVQAQSVGRAVGISEIVNLIESQFRVPVVDKTGLTAKYDFNLEFLPDTSRMPRPPQFSSEGPESSAQTPDEPGQTLIGALQTQLGLKLDSKKVPVDLLIIDSMDRTPTEN